jgi:hypothetical protein
VVEEVTIPCQLLPLSPSVRNPSFTCQILSSFSELEIVLDAEVIETKKVVQDFPLLRTTWLQKPQPLGFLRSRLIKKVWELL